MSIREYRIDKLKLDDSGRDARYQVYGSKTVVTDDIAKAVDDFTDRKTDRVNVTIIRHYADESEINE